MLTFFQWLNESRNPYAQEIIDLATNQYMSRVEIVNYFRDKGIEIPAHVVSYIIKKANLSPDVIQKRNELNKVKQAERGRQQMQQNWMAQSFVDKRTDWAKQLNQQQAADPSHANKVAQQMRDKWNNVSPEERQKHAERARKTRQEWWSTRNFWDWLASFDEDKRVQIVSAMYNNPANQRESPPLTNLILKARNLNI
jgi:hypothetical protein